MATNYNLKFYKGGNQPQEAGSIWFKDGVLSVIGIDGKPEYFSGVRDANFSDKVLTIVRPDGTEFSLDFSDVASTENVNSLLGGLNDKLAKLRTDAETGIQEAKDAAQDAADAAGAVADDLAEYVEANNAAVDVIRQDLAGYKTTNDNRVKAVEDRATALEGKVDGEDGLIKKVETLENLFTGTEGGVQDIVTGEIAKLGGEATGEGTYVDVKVTTAGGQVTGVVVTEDFTAITNAITAEAERAGAAEKANADAIAAEKARIDALIGSDVPAEGEDQLSIREIVIDEVATQLTSENISDSFDTLKEMAEWLSNHPEDVQEMNDAINANTEAIATLNGNAETAGSVAKAVADVKAEVLEVIAENEEVTAAAYTELDGRVDTLEGKVKTLEDVNADNRLTAVETAVNTTLPAAIATAKSEAVSAAAEDATTKANAAQAAAEATAAQALAAEVTRSNKYADDAVAVEAAKVAKNAEDIAALQTQVNTGLSWAHFE